MTPQVLREALQILGGNRNDAAARAVDVRDEKERDGHDQGKHQEQARTHRARSSSPMPMRNVAHIAIAIINAHAASGMRLRQAASV